MIRCLDTGHFGFATGLILLMARCSRFQSSFSFSGCALVFKSRSLLCIASHLLFQSETWSRLPKFWFLQLLPMSPWSIIKSSQFLMAPSTILLSIADILLQRLMLLGLGYLKMVRTALISTLIHITDYQLNPTVKPTRLTREQLLMIGKEDTPSKVKFREEDGGGYMASLEVTHQLHCLVNAETTLTLSNVLTSSPRTCFENTPTTSTMKSSTRLSLAPSLRYSVCI